MSERAASANTPPNSRAGHKSDRGPRGAEVQLEDLTKYYGDTAATNAINLTIAAGEFFTFLGPSGSGKSTTLMMIAGLVIPNNGDIRIHGKSIVRVPVHQRNIGMVFQDYALFPHLNVVDNIAFPLKMRGMKRPEASRRAAATLELMRLGGFESRRPSQLSGGQRQRVALARALVFEPAVLLLDEPLGALDAKLREEMKFELKQLHQSVGCTILFVTHDQEEALMLSDRVAVFNQGGLAQVGTPEALYRYPANRFVADFIGETNLVTGRVGGVEGGVCRLELGDGLEMRGVLREGFPQPKKWATYAIRLEKLTVGEAAKACDNSYQGVVEEYLYVGDSIKYLLRLSPNWCLRLKVPDQAGMDVMPSGSRVVVGWNEADSLLIETEVEPADGSA